MEYIGHIHTQFPEKFGIPRQSGLVPKALGCIVFEPTFRNPDAVRGLEEFSHLWLLWEFSKSRQSEFHATVSPPRLGGKEKRGVFATRSPFRPNSIGLSCVKLEKIELNPDLGPVITVSAVDMLDDTPIYDIKPYLPYTDAHPEARNGFAEAYKDHQSEVVFPQELLEKLPVEIREAAISVLAQDPRAAYQKKPDYVYGMAFDAYDIRFTASETQIVVKSVEKRNTDFQKIK